MEEMKETFEDYIKKNKELLNDKNFKEEDFILIKARNPEYPNQIVEQNVHKSHYQKIKQMSIELSIPIEEMIFITLMSTLVGSEKTPMNIKKEIREFLDRQLIRMKTNVSKELLDSLKNITIRQLKNKLSKKFSVRSLDSMELSWREEFKTGKSEYKDEDVYVKIKLASLIRDN